MYEITIKNGLVSILKDNVLIRKTIDSETFKKIARKELPNGYIDLEEPLREPELWNVLFSKGVVQDKTDVFRYREGVIIVSKLINQKDEKSNEHNS